MIQQIHELKARGKTSIIIVVAEGGEQSGVNDLDRKFRDANCPFPTRTLTLGHVQRGGTPTPSDRILATQLGDHAVSNLVAGANSVMTGKIGGKLVLTPFVNTFREHKPLPINLQELLIRMTR